jgi:nicotinate phosphoribosyltransferase
MHPAIAPMIERNAYIGGCDGFSVIATSDVVDMPPTGTMPHALVLLAGDLPTALRAFDEAVPEDVSRVALVDTFEDEKFASLAAADTLGEKLSGVRLDTPSNRRGEFVSLAKEVRWELDRSGYEDVDIFMSGGLDENTICQLNEIADGYGVGTSISNSKTIDFALDIIEIEGEARTKRGKLSGQKAPMRCTECREHWITPADQPELCPQCNQAGESILREVTRAGDLLIDLPEPAQIRDYVMAPLDELEHDSDEPTIDHQ